MSVTVAAINRFEEQLLETPDQDLVTRKSLYESIGDGCAAMKNFAKALEYYFLMLKVCSIILFRLYICFCVG